jgi:hypothetical protein
MCNDYSQEFSNQENIEFKKHNAYEAKVYTKDEEMIGPDQNAPK